MKPFSFSQQPLSPEHYRAALGDPAAGGYADAYMEQLRTDKQLELFDQVTFTTTPARNPATGKMAVEFFLRTKPAAAGGKK